VDTDEHGNFNRVKITDFGVAKTVHQPSPFDKESRVAGHFSYLAKIMKVGTGVYIPPEVYRSHELAFELKCDSKSL
jgi:serine/threonine protein kinase